MQGPDDQIMSWIDDHRVSWITSFTKALLHVNETHWILTSIGLAAAGVIVWRRAWRVGISTVWAVLTAGWISSEVKGYFERPRPQFPDALVQVDGWAMPSNHSSVLAAGCITFVCAVAWSSRRARLWTSVVLALGTLVIGLAMIYLGAHWPTDVLAGWALGGAIGAAFGFVFKPRADAA